MANAVLLFVCLFFFSYALASVDKESRNAYMEFNHLGCTVVAITSYCFNLCQLQMFQYTVYFLSTGHIA